MQRYTSDDEGLVRNGMIDKVRRTLGRVPFAEEAAAAYYCAIDPATPAHVKGILVAALAYFIMPADAVPDIIAGLGFTDDAAVFWAAWNAVRSHVTDAHTNRARDLLRRLRGEAGNTDADSDAA